MVGKVEFSTHKGVGTFPERKGGGKTPQSLHSIERQGCVH